MKPRLLLREKWVSPSTVSNLNKKIYAKIEAWRNRHIEVSIRTFISMAS